MILPSNNIQKCFGLHFHKPSRKIKFFIESTGSTQTRYMLSFRYTVSPLYGCIFNSNFCSSLWFCCDAFIKTYNISAQESPGSATWRDPTENRHWMLVTCRLLCFHRSWTQCSWRWFLKIEISVVWLELCLGKTFHPFGGVRAHSINFDELCCIFGGI